MVKLKGKLIESSLMTREVNGWCCINLSSIGVMGICFHEAAPNGCCNDGDN